ncbi:MAG TPA: hypothetical protein PK987_02525 [Ferruginibacter sp.]|nr:hypothetical protein [Ferruginibacter sp.]
MAINKNHEFDELDGVKCGIVEKNVLPERVKFLKNLLEYNGFTVNVVPSPPPKAAPAPKPVDGEENITSVEPVATAIETFTVGVTDYTFNTINAIFGRLLKTPNGHVVTLAYWQQKENISHDEIPYYEDV